MDNEIARTENCLWNSIRYRRTFAGSEQTVVKCRALGSLTKKAMRRDLLLLILEEEKAMIEELEDVILTCDLPSMGWPKEILAPLCSFTRKRKVTRSNSLRWMEKPLRS